VYHGFIFYHGSAKAFLDCTSKTFSAQFLNPKVFAELLDPHLGSPRYSLIRSSAEYQIVTASAWDLDVFAGSDDVVAYKGPLMEVTRILFGGRDEDKFLTLTGRRNQPYSIPAQSIFSLDRFTNVGEGDFEIVDAGSDSIISDNNASFIQVDNHPDVFGI
jgi:hypothetical protein